MTEFAIAILPLLVLLVALLLGRYPGCETALRLAARLAAGARSIVADSRRWRRPRRPPLRVASGGLLLAFGLCGRAPPV
jgi:hypothetical protein